MRAYMLVIAKNSLSVSELGRRGEVEDAERGQGNLETSGDQTRFDLSNNSSRQKRVSSQTDIPPSLKNSSRKLPALLSRSVAQGGFGN